MSDQPTPDMPDVIDPRLVRPVAGARRVDGAMPLAEPGLVDPARVRPLALTTLGDGDSATVPTRWRGLWGGVVLSFAVFVSAFWIYDAARSIQTVMSDDPVGGSLLGALGIIFVSLLVAALGREVAALGRLKEAQRLRTLIEQAGRDNAPAALARALETPLRHIARRHPDLVAAYRAQAGGTPECDEILIQMRRQVLAPLDDQARRAIRVNLLAATAGVAASPHPALDLVIVVWRGFVLVRAVAEVYGLRPSPLATLRLFRHALVSGALAATAGALGEAALDVVGRGLVQRLARLTGEASVIALRLTRLGLTAIDLCRPLPMEEEELKGTVAILTGA